MAVRCFKVKLSKDEIQPIDVPERSEFLTMTWDGNGNPLLHAIGDFSQGSTTRIIVMVKPGEALIKEATVYIGALYTEAGDIFHYFEALDV